MVSSYSLGGANGMDLTCCLVGELLPQRHQDSIRLLILSLAIPANKNHFTFAFGLPGQGLATFRVILYFLVVV